MYLYLIQHGEAKSKEEDPQRGLNDTGIANAKKSAAFLKSRQVKISSILHSGKKRAEQTAAIIAEALEKTVPLDLFEEMAPNSDIALVKKEITQSGQEAVALVGHLPHLSRLASVLLTGNPDRELIAFRNAGIVCLYGEGRSWEVEWMIVPALLGDY
jgi:phosphohistidine phosphatase